MDGRILTGIARPYTLLLKIKQSEESMNAEAIQAVWIQVKGHHALERPCPWMGNGHETRILCTATGASQQRKTRDNAQTERKVTGTAGRKRSCVEVAPTCSFLGGVELHLGISPLSSCF